MTIKFSTQKNWVWVRSSLPHIVFKTKRGDFPYPIYDLTETLMPCLRPDSWIKTPFQTFLICISSERC